MTDTRQQRVERLERAISYSLRAGVLLSLILVVIGLALSFTRHPERLDGRVSYQELIATGGTSWRTLPAIAIAVRQGRSEALIMLGLLVLICTPILRVGVSIVLFAYQGDGVFVAITGLVFLLLSASFLIGRAGG